MIQTGERLPIDPETGEIDAVLLHALVARATASLGLADDADCSGDYGASGGASGAVPSAQGVPDVGSYGALVALYESGALGLQGTREVSAQEYVELAAAAARLVAFGELLLRQAAAGLDGAVRPDATRRPSSDRPMVCGAAAEELATRIGCTRHRAQRLVGEGVLLETTLQPAADLLAAGVIDVPRLGALCDHLVGQPVEICDVVLYTLRDELPWLTPSRLSAKVQRLVMAADTQSAAERHALARTRRRVSAPRLLADGMASLSVTAPLLDVALIDTAVEAMARAARKKGQEGTLVQLRADALATLAATTLAEGEVSLPEAARVQALVERCTDLEVGVTPGSRRVTTPGTAAEPGMQVRSAPAIPRLLGKVDEPHCGEPPEGGSGLTAVGSTWDRGAPESGVAGTSGEASGGSGSAGTVSGGRASGGRASDGAGAVGATSEGADADGRDSGGERNGAAPGDAGVVGASGPQVATPGPRTVHQSMAGVATRAGVTPHDLDTPMRRRLVQALRRMMLRWAVPGATPDPGLAPWEPVRDGVDDSRRTPPDTAAAPRRSPRSNDTPMRPLRLPGGGNPVAAPFDPRHTRLVLRISSAHLDADNDPMLDLPALDNPMLESSGSAVASVGGAASDDPGEPQKVGHADQRGWPPPHLAGLRPGEVPDLPELVGFGPVTAPQARELCAERPRWLHVVAIPTPTATPLSSATPQAPDPSSGYAIPESLRRAVIARHPTCVAPGCAVVAAHCDLDHVTPYPLGPTAEWNLRPLCRHHHRLKTHHGYTLALGVGGSTTWTTPLGQQVRIGPSGVIERSCGYRR